jgi:hypothetical protein
MAAVLCTVCATSLTAQSPPDPLEAKVRRLSVTEPLDICGAGPLFVDLARQARISSALESQPGPCWNQRPPAAGPLAKILGGVTVREALDYIARRTAATPGK